MNETAAGAGKDDHVDVSPDQQRGGTFELVALEHLGQRGGGDLAARQHDWSCIDRDIVRHYPVVLGQDARIARQGDQTDAATSSIHDGSLTRVIGSRAPWGDKSTKLTAAAFSP